LAAGLGVKLYLADVGDGATDVRVEFDRSVESDPGSIRLLHNMPTSTIKSSKKSDPMSISSLKRPLNASVDSDSYATKSRVRSFGGWWMTDVLRNPLVTGPPSISVQTRINDPLLDLSKLSGANCSRDPIRVCFRQLPDAAELWGVGTTDEISNEVRRISDGGQIPSPVLFIHGYARGGALGGGVGTWGDFPTLARELSLVDRIVIPYEFRWRTAASFTVVADDLAAAIAQIYAQTGQPVTVVAHSYGGLLIRTLLQGLQKSALKMDPSYVRSVLTLGTPHSGVFDDAVTQNGVSFPRGQFGKTGVLVDLCGQASCQEAGERVGKFELGSIGADALSLLGILPRGDLIFRLASDEHQWPRGIPLVVGIGLMASRFDDSRYDDGDGLISFAGQRLLLNGGDGSSPYLQCDGAELPVMEVILGSYSGDNFDLSRRPGSFVLLGRGYVHSTALSFYADDPDEVYEPFVTACDDAESCAHGSFRLFRDMIKSPDRFCDVRGPEIPRPVVSLYGSEVQSDTRYPTADSVASNRTNVQIVGDAVEFPNGSRVSILPNLRIIDNEIDIGPDYIEFTALESVTLGVAEFNGLVFDFYGAPRIVDAWIDPETSIRIDPGYLAFDDDSVILNMRGISLTAGSKFKIRLRFDN
jgi:pimeloyl-ACP methyl ester carboxylesterase